MVRHDLQYRTALTGGICGGGEGPVSNNPKYGVPSKDTQCASLSPEPCGVPGRIVQYIQPQNGTAHLELSGKRLAGTSVLYRSVRSSMHRSAFRCSVQTRVQAVRSIQWTFSDIW